MKILRYFVLIMSVALLSCNDDGGNQENPPIKPKKEQTEKPKSRKLLWADEFNYNGLPDANKWNYEEGFVRNKEQQYYTKARIENAHVHNGYLEINAIKEEYPNKFYKSNKEEYIYNKLNIKIAHYTSASINTKTKYSVRYGRIEMRAKLPKGRGVWPAFWLLGADYPDVKWPKCGEVDIMEYVGKYPNIIQGTIHGWDYKRNKEIGFPQRTNIFTTEDWHIYAIEWSDEKIDFYTDSKLYGTLYFSKIDKYFPGTSKAFKKPFYILLNFAVGGLWGKQMMEIDDSIFPQSYKIDYVRVYEVK